MKNYQFILILATMMQCFISSCNKDISEDANTDIFPFEAEILADIIKPENIDAYEYPITPGSPGWGTLKPHERSEVMQIPDSILQNMSTWGLVETCFNYPLYGVFTIMDDYSSYINSLSSTGFNGLKELYSRNDVEKILLYSYRHLNIKNFENENLLKLNFIELIVGCDKFISQLDQNQCVFLVAVALEKANEQRNKLDIGPFSVFVMGNTMIHANYKPFIDHCSLKKEYVYMGILKKFNTSDEKIEEYAKNFIKL